MKKTPKQPTTATDRAPMCKICEHRHWARDGHTLPKKKRRAKVTRI